MNKTIRVLAVGCYGAANVGDELLLLTLNQWVSELGGELTVVSLDPQHTSSVMNLPAVSFFDVSEIARIMEKTDLMVMGGGGIFQDHYRFNIGALYDPDAYEIASFARPFYIAKQFGIPTLIWAHGVGPLRGAGGKDVVRDVFSTADFVSVRDKDSAELLNSELGIKRPILVAPDPSWSLISSPSFFHCKRDLGLPAGKKKLGLIVRSWSIETGWTQKLIDALKDVLTSEWECVWIGFQTVRDTYISVSDKPFLKELAEQLGGDVSSIVVDDLLPEEAGAIINQCDAVLAMRLHGAIISLAAGVPTLSYEYDKKMGLAMDMVPMPSHLRVQLSDPSKMLAEALRHVMGQTGPAWHLPPSRLKSLATAALEHRKILAEAMENAQSRKMDVHWEAGKYDWLGSWQFGKSYKARVRDSAAAERDNAAAERDSTAAERDSAVAGRDSAAAERDSAAAERDSAAAERDSAVAERDSAVAGRDSAAAERDSAVAERDSAVAERDSAVAERDSAVALARLMTQSGSWRLTRPLRFAARLARYGLTNDDRLRITQSLRYGYHRLPLSAPVKKITSFAYHKVVGKFTKALRRSAFSASQFSGSQIKSIPKEDSTPDYIVWGVIDWHFRHQRPQQLAVALAGTSRRVFYISPNFLENEQAGFDVEVLDASNLLFQVKLFVKNAPVIYSSAPSIDAVSQLRASIGEVLAWAGCKQIVSLVDHPFWLDVAAALPNSRLVYDCMDHHEGFGNNAESLMQLEEKLLSEAELTITTSTWLDEAIAPHAKRRALIRNAGEYEHFAKVPESIYHDPQGHRIIGYYGAIAEWFDLDLVEAVAKQHPGCAVLLIGADTVNARSRLAKLPNVIFTGEVPYSQLPHYLHGFDVCLLPFKVIPLTLATNPVKAYEYLGAGKPIVTVDLPEMAQFDGLVYAAAGKDAFLAAVNKVLSEPEPDSLLQQRKAFAKGQTWQHRAAALIKVVESSAHDPKVSVVVVTYNNLDFTRACLASLDEHSQYERMEIIVVDNASSDGTPAFLSEWVANGQNRKLILNEDNRGFAAANNQGLEIASGEYLALLNNDTYVTPGWIRTLVRHLKRDVTLGLIGPVTNNIGNEARIDIAYADMDEMLLESAAYTHRQIGKIYPLRTAAFFCVMMPRTTFASVGTLDEAFGRGFFEDDDYCRRIEQLGLRIACAKDVFIHHHLSASFNKLRSADRQALFEQNKAIYEAKWGTWTPHTYINEAKR